MKPLSANSMFWKRGKLTKKTKDYEAYQREMLDELMGVEWPFETGLVYFKIVAGLSARQADLDDVLKPLLDTFQGIFPEFNDNKVYHINTLKRIVPKGEEYLKIRIEVHEEGITDEDFLREVRE